MTTTTRIRIRAAAWPPSDYQCEDWGRADPSLIMGAHMMAPRNLVRGMFRSTSRPAYRPPEHQFVELERHKTGLDVIMRPVSFMVTAKVGRPSDFWRHWWNTLGTDGLMSCLYVALCMEHPPEPDELSRSVLWDTRVKLDGRWYRLAPLRAYLGLVCHHSLLRGFRMENRPWLGEPFEEFA